MTPVRLLLLAPLLGGCVTPERSDDQQRALAEATAVAIVERCRSFGFQPHTDAHAQCVATEVRAIEARLQGNACQRARQDAYYWCNGPGRQQPVLAGYNCPQASQRVQQSC